jgi:hypothetical protein
MIIEKYLNSEKKSKVNKQHFIVVLWVVGYGI